ncbi:MAG: hypothetical protein ABIU87_01900 [Ornithinibacter sp.]
MPITTRAPLARHLAAAALAGALVLAPTTAVFADETPSPEVSSSATATPEPSGTVTPVETPTPSESPTEAATSSASTTSTATQPPPTPELPGASAPAPGTAAKDAPTLVSGGTARVLGPQALTGPATSTDPALIAAHYLEQQLVASGNLFINFGFPDYGLTADAVLALDAAGTGQVAAAAATAVLAKDPNAYTGFGDPAEVYAGSVAKLLNVAVAQKIDPTAFGGVNLVATLQGLEQGTGRFSDVSQYGDYSNTFGQSFALIGLHRAGAGPSSAAVAYLIDQQCPAGGFQLYMSDTGCTDDTAADPDATAMAVQALLAAGGGAGAASDGLDYLTSRQGSDGGVGGAGLTSSVNANSTGLAGQAFLAGGRSAQARLAVSYLEALQYGCSFPAALRGGIAYDSATFASQKEAGATATPSDQDRRSTAQALLALAGTPLGSVTSAGSDAVAPEPACTTPAPTQSPSTSPNPPTSSTGGTPPTSGSGSNGTDNPPAAGGGSTPDVVPVSKPSGSLAQTGSDLILPVGLGALLVVLGAAAVLSSRRRGAHA